MDRILGQSRAIDTLRQALASARLHHAWIFSGPAGVGKCTTAIAFAKRILDPGDDGGESSRLVDSGTHPDLHVVRKELALVSDVPQLRTRKLANIPVDLLREHVIGGTTSDDKVRDAPAYRTATMGHGKVFIIDEAELIDTVGQNALLKTLEEPPPLTYVILVTSRPERLLPTILSRCHHVRFTALSDAAMAAWMDRALPDLSRDDRAWIARSAEGRPGTAAIAAEYGFRAWAQRLEPMLAEADAGAFPVGLGETLAQLVDDYAERWVKSRRNASIDAAKKDGAHHLFQLLATRARERLARGASDSEGADPGAAMRSIDLIRAAELQLEANVNLKQLLENLAVQWATAPAAMP
jgi:DNA polymerase-3 subunit delta'